MVRANLQKKLCGVCLTKYLGESDFLAFLLIIFLAVKSRTPGLNVPRILDVIAKDATRYFLVIFTSHLVFALTLNLARVSATVPPSVHN